MQQSDIKTFIDKTIEINVSPDKVWRVFTDPSITKLMGGEYVSNWQIGSSFGWKGTNGVVYTNGVILKLKHESLLQHSLLDLKDSTRVISIITYELRGSDATTTLKAHEDLFREINDEEYKDALIGWDVALNALKQVAEKL